ncbi:hypothetical protein GSI_04604 [Ganoderma sinense ZZ0214-1]|uniref:Uncharacterized protein n=1 Tax=Ganoderma sinense ZZ0214-1 TaxID=1077348 RepID=A0A2G8SHA0_9APHY|nr:hypothetical protein GSI_04604 [Ganoderma sinense ZZ0214-1]
MEKNLYLSPEGALADTCGILDAPEVPTPAPKVVVLDTDDVGYDTVTPSDYEPDSDWYSDSDSDSERPPAKRPKITPLVPRHSVDSHMLKSIRSRAQPIAQRSQSTSVGPTLAELRTRSDVPLPVKDWVALSTAIGLYAEDYRLPPHFAKAFPQLFATAVPSAPLTCPAAMTSSFSSPATLYPVPPRGDGSFSPLTQVLTLPVPASPVLGMLPPGQGNHRLGATTVGVKSVGPVDSDGEVEEADAVKSSSRSSFVGCDASLVDEDAHASDSDGSSESKAAARRKKTTPGPGDANNEDVLLASPEVTSWDTHASTNKMPETPRTSPFLHFDEGAHVNRPDLDDLNLDDPGYDTASTLDASDSESESEDEDCGAMPPPKNIPMPLSERTKTNWSPQPQRLVTPRSLIAMGQPPPFGPTIPELLIRDDISPAFRAWAMESHEAAFLGDRPLASAKFATQFPEVFFPPFLHHSCPDTYFASVESFPARYEFIYTSKLHPWTQTLEVPIEVFPRPDNPRNRFHTCPVEQSRDLSRNGDKQTVSHVPVDYEGSLPKIVASRLPTTIHDGDRWHGKFIPTILQFLGTQSKSPWCITVRDLPALQHIWVAVYGETLSWTIEVNDCVYVSVMASIREWRNCISDAAIWAFERFFQSSRKFSDFAARCQFCRAILHDSRLFYETFDAPFKRVTLAQHLYAIRGAVHVPSMYSSNVLKHPWGAIGLSAAAVYRAAFLFKSTQIRYINSSGGSHSAWENHLTFGEVAYGAKAKQYSFAASRLATHEVNMVVKAASAH